MPSPDKPIDAPEARNTSGEAQPADDETEAVVAPAVVAAAPAAVAPAVIAPAVVVVAAPAVVAAAPAAAAPAAAAPAVIAPAVVVVAAPAVVAAAPAAAAPAAVARAPAVVALQLTSSEVEHPASSTSVVASASAGPPTTELPEAERQTALDEESEGETSSVTSEQPKDEDPVPMEEGDTEEAANSATGGPETSGSDSRDLDETMEEDDQSKPEGGQLAIKPEIKSGEDERSSSMEEDQPKPAGVQSIAIKAGSIEKDESSNMEQDQPKPDDSDDSISSAGGQLSSMGPNITQDKNIEARDRPHIKLESDTDSNNRAGEKPKMGYEERSSGPNTPGSDSLEGAAQARFKSLYRAQQRDTPSDTNSPVKSVNSDSPVSEAPSTSTTISSTFEAVAGPSSMLTEFEKAQLITESVDSLTVANDGAAPSKRQRPALWPGLVYADEPIVERHFTPVEKIPDESSNPYQNEFIKFCKREEVRREQMVAEMAAAVAAIAAAAEARVGEPVAIVRPQPTSSRTTAVPSERPFAGVGEDLGASERRTADSSTSPPRVPESSNSATSPIPISTSEAATSPMVIPIALTFADPLKDSVETTASPTMTMASPPTVETSEVATSPMVIPIALYFAEPLKDSVQTTASPTMTMASPPTVETSEVATSPMVIPISPIAFEEEPLKDSVETTASPTKSMGSPPTVESGAPQQPAASRHLKTPPKRKRSHSDSQDDHDDKSPQKLRKMDISPEPMTRSSTPTQDDSMTIDDSNEQMKGENSKSPTKEA